MNFYNDNHSNSLLSSLNELRKTGQLCDVTLNISGEKILAHRNVLSASCPYFQAMFTGAFPESQKKEINIHEIDPVAMKAIIDFIYTGTLQVKISNVQGLLTTATFLQMLWIQERCCDFLEASLDPYNCVGIRRFAEKLSCFDLANMAKHKIIKHFLQVITGDEFLTLDLMELQEILATDEVYAHTDNVVLIGILKWVKHSENRRDHLPKLINYIHPSLVDKHDVRRSSLLMNDPRCADWLSKVIASGDEQHWNIFILDKMGRNSDMLKYNLELGEFAPLRSLPEKAFAVGLAGLNHFLYVQGGCVGRSRNRCFYYNIYRNRWHSMTPMREPRSHHRSCIADECLYALGGNGLDGALCSAECMDLTTGRSMEIEEMLEERSSMGVAVYDNCLYVMGGESDRKSLKTMERYDPRVGSWDELNSLKIVNSYCTSAIVNNQIYCCEGLSNSMERYDFRANEWEVIRFAEDREFYEIFSIDNELYSIAGSEIAKYSMEDNEWSRVFAFPTVRDWDTVMALKMHNT